jgi:hypothetical protein
MRIEAPSARFLALFLQHTGYRLAADADSESQPRPQPPALRLDFHSGPAEVDLKGGMQLVKTTGAFIDKLASSMARPPKSLATQTPPKANVKKFQPSASIVAEFCVAPAARVSSLRVWMTPFVFVETPEVSVSSGRAPPLGLPQCLEAAVSLKGGSLALAVLP